MSKSRGKSLGRSCALFVLNCAVCMLLMLFVRRTGVALFTIGGDAMQPTLEAGDRVLVNRWSYGLRTGGRGSLFSYGRLLRQPVTRGDLMAFEDPRADGAGRVLVCRCMACPGDTVSHGGQTLVVPGVASCADADYYWMEAVAPALDSLDSRTLGFVAEQFIVGRVTMVVYSHHPDSALLKGWNGSRLFKPL